MELVVWVALSWPVVSKQTSPQTRSDVLSARSNEIDLLRVFLVVVAPGRSDPLDCSLDYPQH